MIFPNILIIDVPDQTVHWRVPVDDTHTEIIIAVFEPSKEGRKVEQFEEPPVTHVKEDEVITEDGEYILGPTGEFFDGLFESGSNGVGDPRSYFRPNDGASRGDRPGHRHVP